MQDPCSLTGKSSFIFYFFERRGYKVGSKITLEVLPILNLIPQYAELPTLADIMNTVYNIKPEYIKKLK